MEEKQIKKAEEKRYLYAKRKLVLVSKEVKSGYTTLVSRQHRRKIKDYKFLTSLEDLYPNEYPLTISAEDAAIHNMEMETMRQALEELSESDKQLIEELFFNSLSEYKYARKINMSRDYVHHEKKRILSKLRKKIENN